MILVNLLPHREAARKRKREAFFVSLAIAALIGGLICGGVYSWYRAKISDQQNNNNILKTETKKLEEQIKDIATLQAEIASLRARQAAVEELQGNRNLPVYLLSELVKQLPDGVYISSMKQDNQNVLIAGVAQSNERVSELLRNLSNNSEWLSKPELIEITAASVALSARDQRRVANFSMRVALKRVTEPGKPASGTSATAGTSPAAASKVAAVVATAPVPAAPKLAASGAIPAAVGTPAAGKT